MLKHIIVAAFIASVPCALLAAEPDADFVEHISALINARSGSPLKLKKGDAATTKATFKPPVDIVIEAKTDSTNLRMSYAADQVIFNWEGARGQLRVDGGPASGKHKPGAGLLPTNKYVTIRWLVTPKKQCIYVDDQLRFEHSGDYSGITNPVSVFGGAGSEITVKSIKVKQLPPGIEPATLAASPRATAGTTVSRVVGTRWEFPATDKPEQDQWIQFMPNGMLQLGWTKVVRTWKESAPNRIEVRPFESNEIMFLIEFDPAFKQGTIIEGKPKGETLQKLPPLP